MRFCSYCGKEIHEQAVMCVHCGKSLGNAVPQQTESNTKFCPVCGNECIKDAVICVKCGQPFQAQSVAQKKPAAQKKVKQKGDVLRIIAIVMFALTVVSALVSFVTSVVAGYGGKASIILLLNIVSSVVILIGLIKANKNPLPGIGYALLVPISILSLIMWGNPPGITTIIGWIVNILVAVMFLKKGFMKNLWFVPAIFSGLLGVINIITRLASDYYVYEYGYYFSYSEFEWGLFFSDFFSVIFSVLEIVVVCLIAKELWTADNAATPVTMDVPVTIPVAPVVAPKAPAVFTETPAESVAPVETPEAPVAETVAPIEMPKEPVDTTVEQSAE